MSAKKKPGTTAAAKGTAASPGPQLRSAPKAASATRSAAAPAKSAAARKVGPHWNRRAAQRPEELVAAAWKIFRAKGFRATRLEDVAREAGVAKTLVYHYFENKEDLLYAAFEAQVARFRSDLEAMLATFDGDSPSAMRLALTAHWERWRDPDWGCLQRLLAGELANNPVFARRWGRGAKPFPGKIIEDIIRRGQCLGEFDPALDPAVAREFIFSALLQQALFHLHRNPGAAKAPLARQALAGIIDLALRCLGPIAPAKPRAAAKGRATPRRGKS